MKKKIIIAAVVIIAAVGIYAYFNFGQLMDLGMKLTAGMKHRDPSKENAAFTLSADELYNAVKNDTAATKKYLGQVGIVTGSITDIDAESGIVAISSIACKIDSADISKISTLKVGDEIKLQGMVNIYNDLMDEVDVSQCTFK